MILKTRTVKEPEKSLIWFLKPWLWYVGVKVSTQRIWDKDRHNGEGRWYKSCNKEKKWAHRIIIEQDEIGTVWQGFEFCSVPVGTAAIFHYGA